MDPEPIVTRKAQNYRLLLPNGRSKFLLQCPVPHEGPETEKILVRQDGDANNNEVSFKTPAQLISVADGSHEIYIHGVLLAPRVEEDCRRGDAVWLYDPKWRPRSKPDPEAIAVVNLRTWRCLSVRLWEVCWVPKYRKLEHADGAEELLTVCGRPVRHTLSKKNYILAIVQRMRPTGELSPAGNFLALEIKELVEQELFRYQNLGHVHEGSKRIQKLFRRMLEDSRYQDTTGPSLTPVVPGRPCELSPAVTTPSCEADESPIEDDEDSEFERDAQALINEGMANLTRPSRPVFPRICNLPAHECRTPPHLFFANKSTRPSHTNRYPTHHHVVDKDCPSGAAHELHCVYASAHVPDCIIPTTVRHTCCTTGVYPWNKRITRPPAVLPAPLAGTDVVVKSGSGVTTAGDQATPANLPIDVEIMCFDARRDLDERGRRAFGVDEREDVVNGEWMFAGASLHGPVGDILAAPGPASVADAGGATPTPAPLLTSEMDHDVFGDRHYYEGDDESIFDGDTMVDESHDGNSASRCS